MLRSLIAKLKNEHGVTAVVIALVIFPLVALTALAIDIGHLYVVDNELQNAADAGALAGARYLYNDDGTLVNTGANLLAHDAAILNKSENSPVEVNWNGGNGGDVQRGHWSFATRTFTPNASTAPVDLWNVSWEDLDSNPAFINAVRVVTNRVDTPAASFFAHIFGYEGFGLRAEAVAYLGFAGTLTPWDVEQPIAICRETILENDEYSCNVGRMINSGQDSSSSETGGWTNFNQDSACTGGTNAQEVRSLVCAGGNPDVLSLGEDMGTNNGEIQSAFNKFIACWESETGKAEPWNMTLPVVSCPDNSIGTCENLRGAVNVNVIWITEAGEDPEYLNVPTQMDGLEGVVPSWSSAETLGVDRWNSFVQHFNLRNVDGSWAPYAKKSIYFLPDCTPHEPGGVSGGENFGVQAKIPVLVQ